MDTPLSESSVSLKLEEIQKRLKRLPQEYEKAAYFDHDITNDDLNHTLEVIVNLISEKQAQEHHVSKQSL